MPSFCSCYRPIPIFPSCRPVAAGPNRSFPQATSVCRCSAPWPEPSSGALHNCRSFEVNCTSSIWSRFLAAAFSIWEAAAAILGSPYLDVRVARCSARSDIWPKDEVFTAKSSSSTSRPISSLIELETSASCLRRLSSRARITLMKCATRSGSNWVPAQRRNSA